MEDKPGGQDRPKRISLHVDIPAKTVSDFATQSMRFFYNSFRLKVLSYFRDVNTKLNYN